MKSKFWWWFFGVIGFFGLLVLAGTFGVGWFLAPQDQLEKVDAIVAISGGDTDARAMEAVRLYQLDLAPKIIFSGAALDPNSPSNALAMKLLAVDQGVPAESIFLDEVAEDTAENAKGVAGIVDKQNIKSIILVTSPYHQRRAYLLFGRALPDDVRVFNHSAPDQQWRRQRWWATPYSVWVTVSELRKTIYAFLFQRTL